MTEPATGGVEPEGMLIYPKVDRVLRERYEILGKRISVCTINLNAPWQAIDEEVRALMF
jgi:5-methylcytosine-specific restriction enzyme subunit McrC